MRKAQQSYRKRHRATGRCADCPAPTLRYRCEYHEQKNREHKQGWYKRTHKRTRLRLEEEGWVGELLKRECFTSGEAAALSGIYGPDAITRLRGSQRLRVEVVGKDPNNPHYRARLYRVRLKTEDQPQ